MKDEEEGGVRLVEDPTVVEGVDVDMEMAMAMQEEEGDHTSTEEAEEEEEEASVAAVVRLVMANPTKYVVPSSRLRLTLFASTC